MTLLQPGDTFPDLPVATTAGESLTLPGALAGHFGIVLFYRVPGAPICNAQLRAFQRATESLEAVGARVVALSVDDQETTTTLVEKLRLEFPVDYGADAQAVSDATGAFVDPDPTYLQSTGFVLGPDGRVIVSVYSSGAIGRLIPDDVVGMVRYVREHAGRGSAAAPGVGRGGAAGRRD